MLTVTVPTETSLSIESIKEIMDGIDPEAMLPEMSEVLQKVMTACRVAVLIGPVILLILGLGYFFLAPKEANYYFGYRTFFGMGSEQAWRFTQRIAGMAFAGLGAVLTIVMLIISAGFTGGDAMAIVWKAVWCLAWEAGLALAAVLGINITAAVLFDHNGERRQKQEKTVSE